MRSTTDINDEVTELSFFFEAVQKWFKEPLLQFRRVGFAPIFLPGIRDSAFQLFSEDWPVKKPIEHQN
jgi:hypothetical protein